MSPCFSVYKFNIVITKYGSILYNVGMDEVLVHYACTFKNSGLYFHFQ